MPVAAYLSGGLDSSVDRRARARRTPERGLHAFGVGFSDERFDESADQDAIAAALGARVSPRRPSGAAAIADAVPARGRARGEAAAADRARAAARAVAARFETRGLKVVLTGEGADELFGGYDIFREDKVRRFWARDPESQLRPLLFAG